MSAASHLTQVAEPAVAAVLLRLVVVALPELPVLLRVLVVLAQVVLEVRLPLLLLLVVLQVPARLLREARLLRPVLLALLALPREAVVLAAAEAMLLPRSFSAATARTIPLAVTSTSKAVPRSRRRPNSRPYPST
jgi:hypothetical protein